MVNDAHAQQALEHVCVVEMTESERKYYMPNGSNDLGSREQFLHKMGDNTDSSLQDARLALRPTDRPPAGCSDKDFATDYKSSICGCVVL